MKKMYPKTSPQSGFTLVEILVGLAVGLLTTLAITQVVSTFEGQKRSTTGSSEAQVNGNVALYSIQQDMQMAGYGLPVFDGKNSSLNCTNNPTVDHDDDAATPDIGLLPLTVEDGGDGLSDTIHVRYGDTPNAGAVTRIVSVTGTELGVETNLSCLDKEVAMITDGTSCGLTLVDDADLAADTTHITLKALAGASVSKRISCIGKWSDFVYKVEDGMLTRSGHIDPTTGFPTTTAVPIISGVVNMQVQYGISDTVADNEVKSWVDPTGAWANPTAAASKRIKAVRVAVVTRNEQLEKTPVTSECTTAEGTENMGPCAWDDEDAGGAAPKIDLSADENWQRYRYRVYETIIPLRNVVWARKAME